ncbi:MAG: hypothetical protein ACI4J0_00220 [Huintestinicola sp.]|uniref:hypothetical protein n=1 Tax=Huintestinicola sp. TaxID=2981661 RepID=UPI003F028A01
MKLFDILFGRAAKKEQAPKPIQAENKEYHYYAEDLAYGHKAYLYPALFELYKYDSEEIKTVAKACTDIIGNQNGRELADFLYELRVDSAYMYRNIKEKSYGRYKEICGDDFPSLLAAGMCHCDGYVRMNCTSQMGQYPKFLPLILCMYNDRVSNVRQAAENAFKQAVQNADIMTIAEASAEVPALRHCGRRENESLSEAAELMRKRLSKELDISSLRTMENFPESRRQKIYSALISEHLISPECAEYIINNEKGVIKDRTELLYIRKFDLSRERLTEYLKNKNPVVRHIAAQKFIDTYGLWEGAEEMLLDSTRPVRELMLYHFRKSKPDFDIAAYCKAHLPDPGAIMALGEAYCPEGEKIALEYVNSENSKIAAAAVYTLCKTASDKYDKLYYEMMSDPRPKAAKAAYKAFVSCGGYVPPEQLYEAVIQSSENTCLCRRYASLLCRPSQGIWEAMPQLVRLYDFPDECVRNKVRSTILSRSCYFIGSCHRRDEIKEILSRSENIPEALKNDILFQIERK